MYVPRRLSSLLLISCQTSKISTQCKWFGSEPVLSGLVLLKAPGYGDIRLSLEMIPDTVNLEEPFDIICKITNCR